LNREAFLCALFEFNLNKDKEGMRRRVLQRMAWLVGALIWGLQAMASLSPSSQTEVRMVINLMDYIAKDYVMAVKDGEVINAFEFDEMNEFASNASVYCQKLQDEGHVPATLQLDLEFERLASLIRDKSQPKEVGAQADRIRDAIIALDLVPLTPNAWPNRTKGAAIFSEACASCHGITGKGDGPAGKGLTPAPTNFHDRTLIDGISALQAFNTITLGIEGTSMRAFSELTPDEIWDLSFYILGMAFEGNETNTQNPIIALEDASTMSNEELAHHFPALDIPTLRLKGNLDLVLPMDLARNYLTQAESAAVRGLNEEAVAFALKAYLKGVEPNEPKIKASDNKLFEALESAMFQLREQLKQGDPATIQPHFERAFEVLEQADDLLGSSERSMWMTATITLSILIREGLEAFFVILAILSILQSMGAQTAIRWVHGGWITAVFFGIIGWFFAGALMQWDAQSRELMEGLIALFAVIVLLYLGFWMHGKTNADKWKAFVEDKVKGLLSRNNMIGLASFSFLVVFREAFESVLFLSSLTVDGQANSTMGVFIGSIGSAIVLFGMAWAMLRWFKRLPISKVFLYSSIVVLALAFVLAGEGIHAIQEGGFVDIHSFPLNLRVGMLGIYPTYESIFIQLIVLALIWALWRYSAKAAAKA
jgi:high-affinity iron transporter